MQRLGDTCSQTERAEGVLEVVVVTKEQSCCSGACLMMEVTGGQGEDNRSHDPRAC